MDIRKLTEDFYAENTHLHEVLDKRDTTWIDGKTRGYGIVLIEFNSLKFGIPFRSRISHKHCFITKDTKGLDFSKSVLLIKESYVSDIPFKIPSDELLRVRSNKIDIQKKFSNYVDRYIDACKRDVKGTLNREYRFTTLINYHNELGLDPPEEDTAR